MRAFLGTALAFLFLPACTLKSGSEQAQLDRATLKLRIEIPQSARKSLASRASTRALAITDTPTALTDFTCFGVNVTGVGVSDASQSTSCSSGGLPLGIYGGLVPRSGGEVTISVPSNVPLTIQAFATITSDGQCPAFFDILQRAKGELGTGPFYEVGRTTRTLLNSDPITINVDFQPATATRAFCTLKDSTTPPGGETGVWDQSTWDNAKWGP